MNLNDLFNEEKVRLDPKCWTGKKIGNPKTKMKGGTRVNNCVPAESVNEMDKSQTPPGRDGSNDSDAGKKEYTAKATTPEKVAKHGEKILNKELNKKQGVAGGSLNEFAPGDGGDSGEEDTLHKYARMWYNGDDAVQQQVEQALARQGWEIGEIESEEGGAFVVRSGDEHGDSYIGFGVTDLTEGWKSALGSAALAGAMAMGGGMGHAQAADLSNYNTQYLQQVASGEHPRPMVSVADAKAELQARANGKQQVTTPARIDSPSRGPQGFSKEYLQKAADPNRFGRYMISIEKAQELLNNMQEGVAEDQVNEKSVSQAQFRTMAAAAHNPKFARKVGISQDVAREFNKADKGQDYKKLPARTTEGEVEKTKTGIIHRSSGAYGGGEAPRAPYDPGKYAKDIDHLDKDLTSKLDKSMGIKWPHGNKQSGIDEGEQQKGADYRDPPEADYGDDYQDMVARVKKLAGLGPLKTVYDPAKRVYRNVPTAVQPKK